MLKSILLSLAFSVVSISFNSVHATESREIAVFNLKTVYTAPQIEELEQMHQDFKSLPHIREKAIVGNERQEARLTELKKDIQDKQRKLNELEQHQNEGNTTVSSPIKELKSEIKELKSEETEIFQQIKKVRDLQIDSKEKQINQYFDFIQDNYKIFGGKQTFNNKKSKLDRSKTLALFFEAFSQLQEKKTIPSKEAHPVHANIYKGYMTINKI